MISAIRYRRDELIQLNNVNLIENTLNSILIHAACQNISCRRFTGNATHRGCRAGTHVHATCSAGTNEYSDSTRIVNQPKTSSAVSQCIINTIINPSTTTSAASQSIINININSTMIMNDDSQPTTNPAISQSTTNTAVNSTTTVTTTPAVSQCTIHTTVNSPAIMNDNSQPTTTAAVSLSTTNTAVNSSSTNELSLNIPNLDSISSSAVFNISCLNVRSATTVTSDLDKPILIQDFISDRSLDILFLTETWLHPDSPPSVLNSLTPPNYSFINSPRSIGKGGGIACIFSQNVFC